MGQREESRDRTEVLCAMSIFQDDFEISGQAGIKHSICSSEENNTVAVILDELSVLLKLKA